MAAQDHVKSAKQEWDDACFVPAGATRQEFAYSPIQFSIGPWPHFVPLALDSLEIFGRGV